MQGRHKAKFTDQNVKEEGCASFNRETKPRETPWWLGEKRGNRKGKSVVETKKKL